MKSPQKNQSEIERKPSTGHERGRTTVAGTVIKTCCAMAALVAVLSTGAIAHQVSMPKIQTNGNLTISYPGIPGQNYVAERTDNLLTPPVTWTSLRTNTADSYGLVNFTNTPVGSLKFYRVRHDDAPLPLVYDVERTGKYCAPPPLPTIGNLRYIQPLPDPFMWADWSGRSTNVEDWECHRAEIMAQIENYEIGPKPYVDPTNITASFAGGVAGGAGTLTVVVTRPLSEGPPNAARSMTLTFPVTIPSTPPVSGSNYPVIIGMTLAGTGGTGSLPSDIFSNCIQVAYLHNELTTYAAGQAAPKTNDQYYLMYPEYWYAGQYSAWSWGVSRLIDGLYAVKSSLVSNTLPVDLKHIAVTGCSYAGKMALFAGAFDERVALTIPQESGGGGATAWRYSETLGGVETIGATDHSWFMQSMHQFDAQNVSRLPEDHHELLALCLPRALYATANPDYTWLANPSCYVASRACQEVYKTVGISDRFGFSIVGGHAHCTFPDSQRPELQAFVQKFLFDDTNANTHVETHPASYNDSVDYAAWYKWWGTTNAVFPPASSNNYTITIEAECASVGTNWLILTDTNASNGKYITINPALNNTSTTTPSNNGTNLADLVVFNFSVTNSQTFHIFARCNNPTANDDSFFVSMDGGAWAFLNGLGTTGWGWVSFGPYDLTPGSHTFSVAYRENGATLDKISISDYPFSPTGLGKDAAILCP